MSAKIIILLIISVIVAGVMITAQNNRYKSTKREEDKVGIGFVLMYLITALILVFGCFGNLIGACGGDLHSIGGQ
jgi:hypothetical protein